MRVLVIDDHASMQHVLANYLVERNMRVASASQSRSVSRQAEPVDFLAHEEIDALISYGPTMESSGLVSESLGAEEVVALSSPDLAAHFNPSDPLSLVELPLIESSANPVRWSDWFAANGMERSRLKDGLAFNRGELAIAAARQGLGVALESRRLAHEDLATGKLVLLGGSQSQGIMCDLHFLTYRTGPTSAAIMTPFRDWLFQKLADEAMQSSWKSSGKRDLEEVVAVGSAERLR